MDKVVVHVCLFPSVDGRVRNGLAMALLQYMLSDLGNVIATDHGHRNSHGESHFSIACRQAPAAILIAVVEVSVFKERPELLMMEGRSSRWS